MPPNIVEPYSDLYFNELLQSSRKVQFEILLIIIFLVAVILILMIDILHLSQESVVKPKYLLALTVGYNQKEIVNRMVSKV